MLASGLAVSLPSLSLSPSTDTTVPGAILAASWPPERLAPLVVAVIVALADTLVAKVTALPSEPGARAVRMIASMM